MNCNCCKLEILGITEQDINGNPICFECWISSKLSTSSTIACLKCLGIGQITNYFRPEKLICKCCNGNRRIPKAETETKISRIEKAEWIETECPF